MAKRILIIGSHACPRHTLSMLGIMSVFVEMQTPGPHMGASERGLQTTVEEPHECGSLLQYIHEPYYFILTKLSLKKDQCF